MQVLALPPTSNLKKVKTLEPFLTSMPMPPPLWCNRALRANLASEPSSECGQFMSSPKKLQDFDFLLWQELQLDHMPLFLLLKHQNVQEVCLKSRGHLLPVRKATLQRATSTSKNSTLKRCNLRNSPKRSWARASSTLWRVVVWNNWVQSEK